MYKRVRSLFLVVTVLALSLTFSGSKSKVAQAADIDCMGAKKGDSVSMLYQMSGNEEASLNQVLKPLADACGIAFKGESTRDQSLLDTRVQAGTAPDMAMPQPAQMARYADKLKDLGQLGAHKDHYADFWTAFGTVNGKWLGLPVKADIKTIIWYSPAVFKAKGYTVPKTWEELDALVEKMVKDGNVPWSMGMESGDATGWTGSDFLQDILLVQQGPDYVNGLLSGKIPYNDAGVKKAYETYGKWAKDPKYSLGGAKGTLSTGFLDAIYKPFTDPPQAMMVKQSGFAGDEIQKKFPDLKYGQDYDYFPVPGAKGLQGSYNLLVAFNDTPAVRATVAYLSSDAGAVAWAEANFGLSPNKAAAGHYKNAQLVKMGEALASTSGFTEDIGDKIPGGFGKAEWTAIVNYVNGKDLGPELDAAAKVQAEALGPQKAATMAATMAATAAK